MYWRSEKPWGADVASCYTETYKREKVREKKKERKKDTGNLFENFPDKKKRQRRKFLKSTHLDIILDVKDKLFPCLHIGRRQSKLHVVTLHNTWAKSQGKKKLTIFQYHQKKFTIAHIQCSKFSIGSMLYTAVGVVVVE